MECNGKESWVRSLGEVWPNQIVDQWIYWLTNPPSVEELPNMYWLITVLHGTKKNDGMIDPEIKSWGQPVKALKDTLINI